jgi:23S rRNA (uracil1939-C5)-methyltransferase
MYIKDRGEPMKKGNEYELTIKRTEFPGYGIADFEGTPVYIKNTVPGQKVKARISKKRKSHAEARLLEVLEGSEDDIDAACPHFAECGGCSHQYLTYQKQLELKKEQVLQLFNKAHIENFDFLGIEGSPSEFEYRNKMEFTFGDYEKGGELSLGMHMTGKSFGILTVDECMLVDNDIRNIVKWTLSFFREKGFPHYKVIKHEGFLRNLVVRKTKKTSQILINIVTTSQIEFDFSEYKDELLKIEYEGELKGIIHTTNDSLSEVVAADEVDILYGVDYIVEDILGLKFKISAFSFFQTNSLGAEKLYGIVRDFMGSSEDKVVFDLYCGTGTIGQIAAPRARKVIGVELIEEAVESANENAKLNGLNNCTFIPGDVAKVIQTIKEKPDIIILDPPRSGVHPVALDYVIKFNAPEIIYVSCNPKSLVENLKVLVHREYNVEKVILMDMFPHTPHVETVVLLRKKAQ